MVVEGNGGHLTLRGHNIWAYPARVILMSDLVAPCCAAVWLPARKQQKKLPKKTDDDICCITVRKVMTLVCWVKSAAIHCGMGCDA